MLRCSGFGKKIFCKLHMRAVLNVYQTKALTAPKSLTSVTYRIHATDLQPNYYLQEMQS